MLDTKRPPFGEKVHKTLMTSRNASGFVPRAPGRSLENTFQFGTIASGQAGGVRA